MVLAAAATPITISAPTAQPTPQPTPATVTADANYGAQVIALENAARAHAHAGCVPLREDPAITKAATEHSQDMRTNNYLGHDSATATKATVAKGSVAKGSATKDSPWDRMKAAGYTAPAAENVAAGYITPQDVVSGWMEDADHKANILNCSIKATGVGYVRADKPGTGPWWTQDFGYR